MEEKNDDNNQDSVKKDLLHTWSWSSDNLCLVQASCRMAPVWFGSVAVCAGSAGQRFPRCVCTVQRKEWSPFQLQFLKTFRFLKRRPRGCQFSVLVRLLPHPGVERTPSPRLNRGALHLSAFPMLPCPSFIGFVFNIKKTSKLSRRSVPATPTQSLDQTETGNQ